MRSPFEHNSVLIVRLAAMIKSGRHTTQSMKGLVGDHHCGPGGWRTLDWRRLCVTTADTDPDRGCWVNG